MSIKERTSKPFRTKNHYNFASITEAPVAFNVKIGKLLVGVLEYDNNIWCFKYSDDFKSQKTVMPLVNFPDKQKIYVSKYLWPFFATRVPSNAQLQAGGKKRDIVFMLQKYGCKTVANPYQIERI